MVALKVDILVAWSTPTALAAKQATNFIPIVAGAMADPVGDELVASLGRPGGNVTGTTFLGPELVAQIGQSGRFEGTGDFVREARIDDGCLPLVALHRPGHRPVGGGHDPREGEGDEVVPHLHLATQPCLDLLPLLSYVR